MLLHWQGSVIKKKYIKWFTRKENIHHNALLNESQSHSCARRKLVSKIPHRHSSSSSSSSSPSCVCSLIYDAMMHINFPRVILCWIIFIFMRSRMGFSQVKLPFGRHHRRVRARADGYFNDFYIRRMWMKGVFCRNAMSDAHSDEFPMMKIILRFITFPFFSALIFLQAIFERVRNAIKCMYVIY